jgi:hypothetical protein
MGEGTAYVRQDIKDQKKQPKNGRLSTRGLLLEGRGELSSDKEWKKSCKEWKKSFEHSTFHSST